MARLVGTQAQAGLVLLLFLASLGMLLWSTWTTLALPHAELQARHEVHAASREMAEGAAPLAQQVRGKFDLNREELDEKLRAIAAQALADYPGLEGGFFIAVDDRFSGYAYPTSRHAPTTIVRNEPPPLEAPLIRKQAQQSLDDGEAALRTEDVETSRVVIFTEPVSPEPWPPPLTTWVMVRLTGPELLQQRLQRSELAMFLALAGVAISLVLTGNLWHTLRTQRRQEQRLRDELRHAEYLSALGRLLAGVAHEVRNPLAAIRSTVQLWQRRPDDPRTPESLDGVVQSVDRLAAMISRLLLFSRVENAQRSAVDVNRLLTETLDLVKAQAADQGIRLETRTSPMEVLVAGSASALRQVFLNLIANAMQAMPRGGCLSCTSAVAPNSGNVEIEVADTGPGIAAHDRPRLFEPFFTTRPEGTGLGLALCREIVANHGGTIEYVVKANAGAVFRILLPVHVEPE